jgi:hypothetical protein
MTDLEAIELAERYLSSRRIQFVKPGKVERRLPDKVEVTFLVPEALNPAVAVVDPPDVIVLIGTESKTAELVYQM